MTGWIRRTGRGTPRPPALRAQRELITALDADVDRQLAAAETASAGITTRASVLIAAAGVTSGLQVSSAVVIPAVLAVLSALVGVGLLLMRTAKEVPILEAEETFWAQPPVTARRNILHWKNGVLLERERSLYRRRAVLVVGFALLAASISADLVISIVHVSCGGGE
ncbi:hypothetical protein [Microbacterium azadirachtae]|uniref:Uncharacterized protein n=1 Tax=Microbacterium azadirachtae TaxID=582680 RepID=A0A0F0LL71_9MICO|nr:hypothetical protein [Microbacterium azadirachtae]KJL32261.1 hypothetical protein RS86_02733 [Microbacterium azadirachtae]